MKITIVYIVIKRPIDESINAGHAIILCIDKYSFSIGIHFVKFVSGISLSEHGKQYVSLTAI
jgi:hypothetical protein